MYVFLCPGHSESVHWDGTWEPIFLINCMVVWESLPFDAFVRLNSQELMKWILDQMPEDSLLFSYFNLYGLWDLFQVVTCSAGFYKISSSFVYRQFCSIPYSNNSFTFWGSKNCSQNLMKVMPPPPKNCTFINFL